MRKLIVVRIVHAPSDMGSASEGLEKSGISTMGRQRWEENQKKIERFWQELETEVEDLGLEWRSCASTRTACPAPGLLGERIVRETAAKGSRNYQIVQKLMDRGAKIEATESADLLRQEYGYIKALLEAKTDEERVAAEERYNQVKDKLLEERDLFIARSIDCLFKGGRDRTALHWSLSQRAPKIAGDIEVKCLD